MTKKDFFVKKIIPQIQEQIFAFEFQIIRNEYVLERLQKELENLERMPLVDAKDPEKALREKAQKRAEIEEKIEEIKRNLSYLPFAIEEEKNFLEYVKNLVEKMED